MLLEACGELCVCDLAAALELPQAVVSRHLACMRAVGLVAARRRGTWVYYRTHPDLAPWAAAVLAALREAPGREVFAGDERRLKAGRRAGADSCGPRGRV